MSRLLRYDEDDINALTQGCDALRAENEKLKEALTQIYVIPNTNNKDIAIKLVLQMQDIAQQALNEVTNSETNYREHLRNMPESEYKRLHENRWENDENEVTK